MPPRGSLLFGGGQARFAYERARDRGLEVVFRSADPGLLALLRLISGSG